MMKIRASRTVRGGRSSVAVALVTMAFALSAGLAAGAGTRSSDTATFTDPAGDAQGGPDVTTVVIDGDVATGMLTFTVTAAGYMPATPDGLERDVLVWLDTDKNPLTGDPADGTDYELSAQNDASGRYWDVSHWDGSQWQSVPQSQTMSLSRSGDVLTWTVNASDLGGTSGFKFYAVAGIWDVAAKAWIAHDDAPDGDLERQAGDQRLGGWEDTRQPRSVHERQCPSHLPRSAHGERQAAQGEDEGHRDRPQEPQDAVGDQGRDVPRPLTSSGKRVEPLT